MIFFCLTTFLLFSSSAHDHHLHSFPTRRSSDLPSPDHCVPKTMATSAARAAATAAAGSVPSTKLIFACGRRDRKSTRLNSSHVRISYAVFCLKKKKTYYTTSSTSNTHYHSTNYA